MRFLVPIGILAIAAGFSAAVMLLWNWLMPAVFGLIVISYWQALGLLVLCRILFGSFGGHHTILGAMMHGGLHGRHHLRKKWRQMTPEQRKEFINKRMEHFARGDFLGGRHFDCAADENNRKDNE